MVSALLTRVQFLSLVLLEIIFRLPIHMQISAKSKLQLKLKMVIIFFPKINQPLLVPCPKKDSNDIRLVHDCSWPPGTSLNSYASIDKEKFQTLDQAVKLIQPGYYMAKVDLKNAYRSVRIHPSNYAATGISWKFNSERYHRFLFDTRLPFGARK